MIRSTFLLCAGLILAMCSACAPPPPPVQPQAIAAASTWPIPAASCNAITLADSVRTLPAFDPSTTNRDPPVGSAVDSDIHDGLQAALLMAPPSFRGQLCSLNGVFVTSDGRSWGYRNANNRHRYVGIPSALWSQGSAPHRTPKSYRDFETDIVQGLLKGLTIVRYLSDLGAPADSTLTTVLAALAHEFGHVLWYDVFVPDPGDPAHRNPPNFNLFCGGTFYKESWDARTLIEDPPPSRWLPWGLPRSRHKSDDVQISDIQTAPPSQIGDLVNVFYWDRGTPMPYGRWANLFAAFSPEEDFVETFKLSVLRKAASPLAKLQVQIMTGAGPINHDIPGSLGRRPVLFGKLGCF